MCRMTRRHLISVGLWIGWVAAAAGQGAVTFDWRVPGGWPAPAVPADNPMSEAVVTLGRHLFYDTHLSGNGTQSCASCHQQALAFTDGRAQAVGSTGERHARGSMSLVNVAYASTLTWAHATLTRLEDQALVPMFGDRPVELGLRRGAEESFLAQLREVPEYRRMFPAAFGGDAQAFTVANVTKALAAFQRTIISARSPYDRYADMGDEDAVPAAAKRGEALYFGRELSCFRCHGGFTFSQPVEFEGRTRGGEAPLFQNNGLYFFDGPFTYPQEDQGLFDLTGVLADVGKYKAPTLRNIAVTAPYMHDGSLPTLGHVIDHYASGGRSHPNRSGILRGFTLTAGQREDLMAFLQSLTDDELLRDPRFANPW